MTEKYSKYFNTEVTSANTKSATNDGAASFTSGSSSVAITQAAGNNITLSGTVTVTHNADATGKRIVNVYELGAGSTGLTNTSLDFDPIDETTFIQEDATNGTDFVGGKILLRNNGNANHVFTP